MSANIRLNTIFDLERYDANLRVTCPKCGRSGVFDPRGVLEYFRSTRKNPAWEVAGSYFRCEGGGGDASGCGHKGAQLDIVPKPKPVVIPKPEPTEYDLRREWERSRH